MPRERPAPTCGLSPGAAKDKSFNRIKTWCVDRFHAGGHSDNCPCAPLVHRRLERRLEGVNTSVAEQTFSWFRSYASIFSTMSPVVHRFMVLIFAHRRNNLIRTRAATHLNEFSTRKKLAQAAAVWHRPASLEAGGKGMLDALVVR